MKHIFFLFLMGFLVWEGLSAQRLVEVAEGYSSTSVNTAVFRNSSLVTDKGIQYVSYYDADGYLVWVSVTWERSNGPCTAASIKVMWPTHTMSSV